MATKPNRPLEYPYYTVSLFLPRGESVSGKGKTLDAAIADLHEAINTKTAIIMIELQEVRDLLRG